jgi:GntR family transcriptional regulator, transcriptional repressor for pyruvate dehydrogenase complex
MAAQNNGHDMELVRPAASYELVLDQVRRAIQLGRFGPGDRLPPERELAQQLGVSRMTVREAMRVLQGEGLVEIRRGRTGGAIVIGRDVSRAEIKRQLRGRLAELEAVIDFRLIVEPAAARLAAERRTIRDLQAMRPMLESMTDLVSDPGGPSAPSRFFALDAEFHHRIGQATRNPMLAAAVDDARAQLFMPIGGIFQSLHPAANVLHGELLEAIEAEDGAAAEATMRRHIALTHEALLELAGSSRRAKSGR